MAHHVKAVDGRGNVQQVLAPRHVARLAPQRRHPCNEYLFNMYNKCVFNMYDKY